MSTASASKPPKPMIRPATEADLPAILEIDGEIPELPRWSRATYESLFQGTSSSIKRMVLVGTVSDEIAGFGVLALLIAVAPPEGEIENLAVGPRWRRHGVGRAVLDAMLAYAWQQGVSYVGLEVRGGNAVALALYASAGFKAVGHRPGYYREPVEDAVLLRVKSVADLRHPVESRTDYGA